MERLEINLLGKVDFRYDGKPLEHKLSNKGIALITLLMLDLGKEISKDKLISYLWADSNEEAARYNLRYNLWMIRKLIPVDKSGRELILAHKDCCLINPEYDFRSDLLQIMQYESKGTERSLEELNAYKDLFHGDFLEGIYLKNCDEFNEKIIFERMMCQNKYVDLLWEIVEKYDACQNYKECIEVLNELHALEPYDEKTVKWQVGTFIKWGKRSDAIRCYRDFEASLRSNLHIAPDQELVEMYRQLMAEPPGALDEAQAGDRVKKQFVEIEVNCIESIDYFCISDILRKIMLKVDKKYIFGFGKSYLEDLNYIQLEIGLGYGKLYTDKLLQHTSLPDVRVAEAFVKFIRYVSELYALKINILDPEEMDRISLHIINYMKKVQIEDLFFGS